MGHSNFVQSSFLGGEWSPFAQGRLDRPDYKTALNVCRNAFPIEEGAWLRRSGSRFVSATRLGRPAKILKFDFEGTDPYFVEITSGGGIRFYASGIQSGSLTTPLPQDMQLATTNTNATVTSISTANPAAVVVGGADVFLTGTTIKFFFAQNIDPAFCPLLRNRQFTITRTSANNFTLADGITGASIDGSTLGWSTPTVGTVVASLVATPSFTGSVPTYNQDQISSVRAIQAETTSFLLNPTLEPYALTALVLPSDGSFATFHTQPVSFLDGPYLDPPTDGSTVGYSGTSGSVTLTWSAATSINGGNGFTASDVGRQVRLLSEPNSYNPLHAYSAGDALKFNDVYYVCLQSSTGNQPDVSPAYWGATTATTVAAWTWATITAVTTSTEVTATVGGAAIINYAIQISAWRLGVYSIGTGFPSCGVYYEGRIWLSGAIANRVDASVVNGISGANINMAPTAPDGTVADDNGISYIFNASDVNPIYWMIGTAAGIVCGTQSGEWLINATTLAEPITPTSIQAHRNTAYGCANIEPEHSELTITFVHRYGRKVLEYFPDVFSGRYNAPNLSQFAKHLTLSGIEEIRYQRELVPTIWARLGDGSLIGATYKRTTLFSSQGPEFIGWHRHDLGSGRAVESIATGPSAGGGLDTLGMVTNDTTLNVRQIEIMQDMFDVDSPITATWLLDSAITPSGGVITTANGASTLTLYGLWHLNGETVAVSLGGLDWGDFAVAAGQLSLPIDVDPTGLFTSTYLRSLSSAAAYGAMTCPIRTAIGNSFVYVPAVVGFTYTSQGQILRPDTVDDVRSPTGPGAAKPGRMFQFGALMQGTQGISFGSDFVKMHAAQFKSPGGKVYQANQLWSGVYWDTVEDTYGFESMLAWQVTRPYPAALMYVVGFQETVER